MNTYFEHMNTYHISFAAFENDNSDKAADYIRGRRYMPELGTGLKATELKQNTFEPDYLKLTCRTISPLSAKVTIFYEDYKYRNRTNLPLENIRIPRFE